MHEVCFLLQTNRIPSGGLTVEHVVCFLTPCLFDGYIVMTAPSIRSD